MPIQVVGLIGLILFVLLLFKLDNFKNKCVHLDLFVATKKGTKYKL